MNINFNSIQIKWNKKSNINEMYYINLNVLDVVYLLNIIGN
jgi:hypothetical protein